MRTTAPALLVFSFGLALTAASPSHAFELRKDQAGNPVRWATSPTFTLSPDLADRLGVPQALDASRAAVATYAAVLPELGITLQVGANQRLGFDTTPGAVNQNDIVPIDHDWPYDENAIAVTLLTVDPRTNEILDADVALNTSAHRFAALPADSTPGGRYDDLQNTLTHELGHAMGLAHNGADPRVVMYPGAPQGEVTKRVLTDDDRAGLAFLYASAAVAPGDPARAAGCAAGPGSSSCIAAALLGLLAAARRSRQVARP